MNSEMVHVTLLDAQGNILLPNTTATSLGTGDTGNATIFFIQDPERTDHFLETTIPNIDPKDAEFAVICLTSDIETFALTKLHLIDSKRTQATVLYRSSASHWNVDLGTKSPEWPANIVTKDRRLLLLSAFLIASEAPKFKHRSKSLYEHLHGTNRILQEWNTPVVVQEAGLLHSVLGTSTFRPAMRHMDKITKLVGVVGQDVARLVKLYACSERGHSSIQALETGSIILNQGGRHDQIIDTVNHEEILQVIIMDCANLVEQKADADFLRYLLCLYQTGKLALPRIVAERLSKHLGIFGH